jgi:autotransporter-associated beta strand protein
MRTASRVASFCLVAAAAFLHTMNLNAAITLPSGVFVYSENFDGTKLSATSLTSTTSPFGPTIGAQLPIPGTSGWDGTKVAGTATNQMPYTVDTGAGLSGSLYSYGAASSTERALGALASGSNSAGFGVELVNNTGSIISSVDLQFITEWWRGSSSQVDGLTFRYQVGSAGSTNYLTTSASTAVPALDMVGPYTIVNGVPTVDLTNYPNAALDGNTKKSPLITGTLSGLNWTPGTSLYLSWRDLDNGGSDAGMGLDDFQLTATPLLGVKPYWDPNGAAAGLGGPGTWNNTSTSWNDNSGTGTPGTFTPSAVAIFSGTGGAVTIDAGGVSADAGIQIESDGYTFSGGTLTLGSSSPITVLNAAATATISAKISGSSGLTKGGAGTLAITSNANDFTGSVTVAAGTLLISNDANLGDANNGLVLNGGTLKVTTPGNLNLSAARLLSGTGGNFDIGAGNTLTLQGAVNMTGPLGLAAPGNITFGPAGSTVGGLLLPGTGTVTVGDGSPTAALTISNAGGNSLTVTTGNVTVNGGITLSGIGSATRFLNVPAGSTFKVTGNVGTTGSVRVGFSGAGTYDLMGDNSQIIGGIQVGNVGSAGPTIKIYNSGSLGTFDFGSISNFMNSGTLQGVGTSPIVLTSPGMALSIGSIAAAPLTFKGADLTFQAPVNIFRPSGTGAVRIQVDNQTTFSRGWNADTGTLTNITGGLVVGGAGSLTISNTSGGSFTNLLIPLTADGATINFNGINSNVSSATANIQIGATNNGRFNLSQPNAYTAGKVVLSSGGRLGTGGVNQTFTTLAVTGNAAIDIGAGPSVVQFADSSAVAWATSPLLSINNWNGALLGGGSEQVLFGSSSAALTAAQVGAIHFAGYNGASILSTGEVVPVSASTKVLGDFDNNNLLTTADIPAMLKALTDMASFRTTNGLATTDDFLNVADVDLNGKVDNFDIQALLGKLSGSGSLTAVPEPATFALAAIALPALVVCARRRYAR